ncbi:MAG TPA: VanZ family protein [Gemmata sp.]|nr:VanZ family protein [Gemmata sp.]
MKHGKFQFLPFAVFLVFLGLWTWKLLEASPVPESLTHGWSLDLKFIASKILHVSAYGFLTLLAAWLPVRRLYFWGVVGVLMLHAIGTEIGQCYVPNRSGSVRDVCLDWFGIGLGLAFLQISGLRRLAGVEDANNHLSQGEWTTP